MNEKQEQEWNQILSDLGATERSEMGIAMHSLFEQLMAGGFTEHQALRIIAYGMFHQPSNGEVDE